jgi:hypothetical protein
VNAENGPTYQTEPRLLFENAMPERLSDMPLNHPVIQAIGNIVNNFFTPGSPNLNTAQLPRWRLALAKMLSGQSIARALGVGDSTSYGIGATNSGVETLVSIQAGSYPTQLAAQLNAAGFPANANGICWGVGANNNNRLTGLGDSRITAGTSWSMYTGASSFALGGQLAQASTNTNALNFAPTVPVDTFRVWYVQSPSAGTIGASVNGGTVTQHSSNGTPAQVKSFTVTAARGMNTLNLTSPLGQTIFINAIEAWDSTAPSIVITNAGWPGAKVSDMSSVNSGAYGYDPLAGALAFAPDLYIVDAGINDWVNNVPVPTYQSQLQTLVTRLLVVADVILVTPAPSDVSQASQATQQAFINAMQAVAAASNVPLVDNWTRWGSHAASVGMYTAGGAGNGLLHPNMIGYADFARSIARVMTAA